MPDFDKPQQSADKSATPKAEKINEAVNKEVQDGMPSLTLERMKYAKSLKEGGSSGISGDFGNLTLFDCSKPQQGDTSKESTAKNYSGTTLTETSKTEASGKDASQSIDTSSDKNNSGTEKPAEAKQKTEPESLKPKDGESPIKANSETSESVKDGKNAPANLASAERPQDFKQAKNQEIPRDIPQDIKQLLQELKQDRQQDLKDYLPEIKQKVLQEIEKDLGLNMTSKEREEYSRKDDRQDPNDHYNENAKHYFENIQNSSKVTDTLYRGANPGGCNDQTHPWSEETLVKNLETLKAKGIKTVVDFEDPNDKDPTIVSKIAAEKAACLALGMHFVNLHMDHNGPTEAQKAQFLQIIKDGEKNHTGVYCHCREGRDRTGFMVAYAREKLQGWSAQKAGQEDVANGYNDFKQEKYPNLTVPGFNPNQHEVQNGDNLSEIARQQLGKVDEHQILEYVRELAHINNIRNINMIHSGDQLVLPAQKQTAKASPAEAPNTANPTDPITELPRAKFTLKQIN